MILPPLESLLKFKILGVMYAVCTNGTAQFIKCKQLFEYQPLLLLRGIW